MAQFDFGDLESPLSGTDLINGNLEPFRDALHTTHSGNARPSYVQAGMMWLNTSTSPWVLNMFDGGDDIPLGKVDATNNLFIPSNTGRWGGSTGGSATAYTLTPTPAMPEWATGVAYDVLIHTTNTVAGPTLNISGQGAKTWKCSIGGAKVNVPKGALQSGMIARVVYDGTDVQLLNVRPHNASTDIATAATLNLNNATGDYVRLTGTTTVTAITLDEGMEKTCVCAASFILTDGSGSSPQGLVLPGGANITTVAGDMFIARGEANGTVRIRYHRGSGMPLPISTDGTLSANSDSKIPTEKAVKTYVNSFPVLHDSGSLSGETEIDVTGIPVTAKKITIGLTDISTNGTSNPMIQIGDSGGIENTGYRASSSSGGAATAFTTGFGASHGTGSASIFSAVATIILVDAATFTWAYSLTSGFSHTAGCIMAGGVKDLSAALDRLRITTVNGTDVFDSGKYAIYYE